MSWEFSMEDFETRLRVLKWGMNQHRMAVIVWNTLLTDDQKCRWPGMEDALLTSGGTVGVWAAVNRQSLEWAVIDLARLQGMPELEYKSLLKQLDPSLLPHHSPAWKKELGELQLSGEVIKRIASVSIAKNVVIVLDAFQEQGWKLRIEYPESLKGDAEAMGQTVKSLNSGLTRIRFERDGTSRGVKWSYVPHGSEGSERQSEERRSAEPDRDSPRSRVPATRKDRLKRSS